MEKNCTICDKLFASSDESELCDYCIKEKKAYQRRWFDMELMRDVMDNSPWS